MISTLKEEKEKLEISLAKTEAANQVLHDEHQALQLAYASIEEKLKLLHVCHQLPLFLYIYLIVNFLIV